MSEQKTCKDCHSTHPLYSSREIYLCPRHASVDALEKELESLKADREYCFRANVLNEEIERRQVIEQRAERLEVSNKALREALGDLICDGCGHRIGWLGEHDKQQTMLGRLDWTKCNHCREARAALALDAPVASAQDGRKG